MPKKKAKKPKISNRQFQAKELNKALPGQTPVIKMGGENVTTRLKHLLARYPHKSPEQIINIYNQQFRQYNTELVARGLAEPKSKIKSLDTIDMQAVGHKTPETHDIPEQNLNETMSQQFLEFISNPETAFYRILPCFSEGVIRVNADRYIYFKILKLDLEQDSVQVYLRDYRETQYLDGNHLWEPGIHGTAIIKQDKAAGEYIITAEKENSFMFYEIYQQIDPKKLNWDKLQRDAWKTLAIGNARAMSEKLDQLGTNNLVQLTRVFMRFTMLSNFILEANKPKIAPGQEAKQAYNREIAKNKSNKSNSDTHKDNSTPEIPEKLIRNVGMIRIISTKTPRAVTSKSIRNYRIPSWTARGHTRTYKSGKTVYIQPTVKHRRALKNPEKKIPQSIIKIVDNLPTKEKNNPT